MGNGEMGNRGDGGSVKPGGHSVGVRRSAHATAGSHGCRDRIHHVGVRRAAGGDPCHAVSGIVEHRRVRTLCQSGGYPGRDDGLPHRGGSHECPLRRRRIVHHGKQRDWGVRVCGDRRLHSVISPGLSETLCSDRRPVEIPLQLRHYVSDAVSPCRRVRTGVAPDSGRVHRFGIRQHVGVVAVQHLQFCE